MPTTNISLENFDQEVLKSKQPTLIDFYADWCGPCKAMAPVIDELAKTYAGRVNVFKVNIDQNQELASQHGVMSIPTFVFYSAGQEKNRLVGSQPKDKISEALDNIL